MKTFVSVLIMISSTLSCAGSQPGSPEASTLPTLTRSERWQGSIQGCRG